MAKRDRPQRAADASALERMIAGRRAANRSAWARSHPEIAAAERVLRKQRAALVERWKHKNDGTPETHEHARRSYGPGGRHQGALARLYQTGAIDAEQLASSIEIATVAERIGADVSIRTASLETRVDMTMRGDGSFFERLGNVRREAAYTRWRAQLRHPAVVLDMVVGDLGVTVVARRYRMHNRKAKQLLIEALDLWPNALGDACREIDDKVLMAAHARLAA